jgi:uncharacterized membrane protein YkvA (DUF1232 family)
MALFFFLRRLLSVGYLMTHPGVPFRLKLLPIIAVIYFLIPRDVFFDYRQLGFLDDFIIGTFLLGSFTSRAVGYLSGEKRAKEEAVKVDFKVLDEDDENPDEPPTDGDEPSSEDLRG